LSFLQEVYPSGQREENIHSLQANTKKNILNKQNLFLATKISVGRGRNSFIRTFERNSFFTYSFDGITWITR